MPSPGGAPSGGPRVAEARDDSLRRTARSGRADVAEEKEGETV